MKLLLIDNYDSFTYNLVQYFGDERVAGDFDLKVIRNDQWTPAQIIDYAPDGLVISPGPGTPDDSGVCLEMVRHYWGRLPMFGVCLGLQAIVQAMGGIIERADQVMHGKLSQIEHDGRGVFDGLDSPLTMTRYHSLVANPDKLPEVIEVSARVVKSGEIMGIRGKVEPMVEAVQFHPESILSELGKDILAAFARAVRQTDK